MDVDTLLHHVCCLPREFNLQDKSPIGLLKEAGFFEAPDVVTPEAVVTPLRGDPTLINDWLLWSDNKSTSSGWYFRKDGQVGFYPSGPVFYFRDIVIACAEFIVRELDEFRRRS